MRRELVGRLVPGVILVEDMLIRLRVVSVTPVAGGMVELGLVVADGGVGIFAPAVGARGVRRHRPSKRVWVAD